MKNKIHKFVMYSLLLLTCSMVQAVGMLPEVQNRNNLSFMIGGSSEDESKAMVDEAKKWPLHVEFTEQEGKSKKSISGVELQIINHVGKPLFNEKCNGPIFLGKLTPGKYQLEAKYEGIVKKHAVTIIDGKSTKVVFHWSSKTK